MNDHKRTGADPYAADRQRTTSGQNWMQRNPGLAIGAIVGVIVVVIALVAVLLSGGSDSGPAAKNTGAAQAEKATQQTAAVSVSGAPLPPFPQTNDLVADPKTDPAVGKTPPTLTGETFDAKPITIRPGNSAMVVLFVAHWCPHCQAEVPRIQEWIAAGKLPKDVEVYTVATATTETRPNFPPSAWIASAKFQPPVLLDDEQGTAASAYGLTGFPYFVMVDKAGKVVARASGEVPIDQFSALVNKLSAGVKNASGS